MPDSQPSADIIPMSFLQLTRAEAKAVVLELCQSPLQREVANHLMLELDGRGPADSRANLRLILLIAQAVAMLDANRKAAPS